MPNAAPSNRPPVMTVILAAGRGTRFKSALPKVLHRLGGRTLIDRVLGLAQELPSDRILVVVGHRADLVIREAGGRPGVEFVVQEPQQGTGHALLMCLDHIRSHEGPVLVLSGDVPSLSRGTAVSLLDAHARADAALTVLTAKVAEPTGYGRVLRGGDGRLLAIREHRDLSGKEADVKEINLGIYAFEASFLADALPRLKNDNAQGEFYLPDLVGAARRQGLAATALVLENPKEALGVNTLKELAEMESEQRRTAVRRLMESGVRVLDPETAYVEDSVQVEPDATLHPMVFLHGKTIVRSGAVIMPGAVIRDSEVGRGAEVRPYSVVTESVVGEGAAVGPFAHLRPGTRLEKGARVGNFVEVKKSVLGRGTKVSHLTYIGDSDLGEDVNVGAGCVTCNYDGFSKHRTVIGDGVFVGSGSMLVAPVTLGDGCLVAAGSTITKDVGPDALALARARQEERPGWVSKWREKKKAEKEKKNES